MCSMLHTTKRNYKAFDVVFSALFAAYTECQFFGVCPKTGTISGA